MRPAFAALLFLPLIRCAGDPLPSIDKFGRDNPPSGRTLVAYFSRSGHTASAARAFSRELQADLTEIRSFRYPPTLTGSLRANFDGFFRRPGEIDAVTIDGYDTIFLGGPVWYWRPAPPLYAFVRETDLQGKTVVLFLTFETSYAPDSIRAFKDLVESRGAIFGGMIALRRRDLPDENIPGAAAELLLEFMNGGRRRE